VAPPTTAAREEGKGGKWGAGEREGLRLHGEENEEREEEAMEFAYRRRRPSPELRRNPSIDSEPEVRSMIQK
jgi:hypothetical protein